MRRFTNTVQIRLLGSALACGLALPAIAQQRSGDDEDGRRSRPAQQDRQQSEREPQAQQRSDQQDQQRQERQRSVQQERRQSSTRQWPDGESQALQRQDRQQRQAGQRRVRVEPQGWVNIGVDYDGDGRFDAVETIFVYDLEMARRQSQRRQQTAQRGRERRSQRTVNIEGEVQDMREIQMHDEDAAYLVARVRTDSGRTAKVLLGKDEQLSQLDLSEGDNVEVEGRRGTINNRGILVALRVRSGDQQVRVQPRRTGRQMEHVQGSVLRTRGARFRGHDETYLIAEIRGEEGRRHIVNMGPKEKFEDVEFGDAGEIRVLGHRGNISGRNALIAEQVYVDGEMIRIAPDERRDRQWREQQRDQQQRDRGERNRGERHRGERHRDWERQDDQRHGSERQNGGGQDRERQERPRGDREHQERDRQQRNR